MKIFAKDHIWMLVLAACLTMVGVVVAQSSPQQPMMPGQMMTVQSEFDYLAQMIPHHEEAVLTAKQIVAGSRRKAMRSFATKIILVQTNEINQMRAWLIQWYPNRISKYFYKPMMRDLSRLSGDTLDQVFLEDMIMHHRMAVMMSQHLLNFGNAPHSDVNDFAKTVRDTQREEIRTMQKWLSSWFGWNSNPMSGCRKR